MSLVVRVHEGGAPAGHLPVELLFDHAHRVERLTDEQGEVHVEPCRGDEVSVLVNGVGHGTFACHDGLVLDLELQESQNEQVH